MALAVVGLHGAVALGVGVVLFAAAWLLARRADRRPPGGTTGRRSGTLVFPQDQDEGDTRPTGMFG
jgi:hypothetical protein